MEQGVAGATDLEAAAKPFGVSGVVHPDDLIWQFINTHEGFKTPESAAEYYMSNGADSAKKLKRIVDEHRPPSSPKERRSIFEFASGYGMVSRHLKAEFANDDIISCDIHPAAVGFIESELGLPSVLSAHSPRDFKTPQKYDVVFALSFFSHMPNATFGPWLFALFDAVADNGLLVFTTHGMSSMKNLPAGTTLDDFGFHFIPMSEQGDIDPYEYGITVSAPDYVLRQLQRHTAGVLREVRTGFWWSEQDVYVLQKTPGRNDLPHWWSTRSDVEPDVQQRLSDAQIRRQAAERSLESVLTSRTWRMTQPARNVARSARDLLRKARR